MQSRYADIMAGRGPVPKDPSERRRRNITPVTVLAADGRKHGPALPDVFDWPDATLKWWETWRTCAQASMFTGTDWSFLVDTAVLHSDLWSGKWSVAPELRLRLAKFGATPRIAPGCALRLSNSLDPLGSGLPVLSARCCSHCCD